MGCRVEDRPCVGVSCGKRCGIFALVCFVLLLFVSLGYSLAARLYLQAYYTSAQVAALTALTSFFALTQHTSCVRPALCCTYRGYFITQSVLNLLYLLCCTVLWIGYVILAVFTVHYNFDYIASACFAGLSVLTMLYLCALTLSSSRGGHASDYEVDIKFVWQSDDTGVQSDMDLHDSSVDISTNRSGQHLVHTKPKPRCTCARCCSVCCRIMFGTLYTLLHIVLIIVFAVIAAQPVFLSFDINEYRDSDYLYTVDMKDHRPQVLFLRCRGNGNETIVLENDIGVTGSMQWDYLPRSLADSYRVCVYNRRGYGWSETFENDELTAELSGKKWLEDQANYFQRLLEESKIHTPVYYVAHGLGAHIMTQVAIDHPRMIKGLVYLDAPQTIGVDISQSYVELACNLNSMSVQHVLTMTSWYGVEEHVSVLKKFNKLSKKTRNQINNDVRQSYYLPTYQRERNNLKDERIEDLVKNHMIHLPVLVLNARCKDNHWFPSNSFSQWNDAFYVGLRDTNHEDIVFDEGDVYTTSLLIKAFIRYTQQRITLDTFRNFTNALPTC